MQVTFRTLGIIKRSKSFELFKIRNVALPTLSEMEVELIKLITSYLNCVNKVLSILQLKVGKDAQEGKSWQANIPYSGHYSDAGISRFHRHGAGIWAYYEGRFVDFDFYDLNLPETADFQEFITIDAGFLARYIESLGIKDERWNDYTSIKEELDKLVEKGVVKKIEYKYYLKTDLDRLELR